MRKLNSSDQILNLTIIDFLMQIIFFGIVYFVVLGDDKANDFLTQEIKKATIGKEYSQQEAKYLAKSLVELQKYGQRNNLPLNKIPEFLTNLVPATEINQIPQNEKIIQELSDKSKELDETLLNSQNNLSCLNRVNGQIPVIMNITAYDDYIAITNRTAYINQIASPEIKAILMRDSLKYDELPYLNEIKNLTNFNRPCKYFVNFTRKTNDASKQDRVLSYFYAKRN